jgi:hypothetical protein
VRSSRFPRAFLLSAPFAAIASAALALAFAGAGAGRAPSSDPPGSDLPGSDAPGSEASGRDPSTPLLGSGLRLEGFVGDSPAAAPGRHDAGTLAARVAPDGAILAPPEDETYTCLQPALAIPRDPGCERGEPYPRCRWQIPHADASSGLYRIWRNTTPEHRWARPGLVSLVLASAREYAARWPGERMTIGDLDAAGPRHQTHDRGVDVDIYLEHAMIARNDGGRRYPDNYAGRPASEVALLRARVLDLARILATCSRGRLRIYYNDPEIVGAFVAWFSERGLISDFGSPMRMHNALHRFHFHVTVAEDLAPLPLAAR